MKINLLPTYIHEKSAIGKAWAIVAAILVLELAGLIFWQTGLLATERRLEADVTEAQTRVKAIQEIESQAQAERAKIAPIQQKVTFVKDLQKYNEQRPNLYARTAEYTLRGIRYSAMNASQNYLQISAWAPTLSDAGRYLLYMQNSPDFSSVRISAVPGYPPGAQGGAGGGGLGDVGAPPDAGTGGAGPLTAGPPGSAGMGGAFGGAAPGGPGPGMGGAPGDMGPSDGGASFGPPPGIGGDAGAPGDFGGGASFGGGGGGGQTRIGGAYRNAGASIRPPRPPQGFPFTVTAQLITPITRPIYGGGQQQQQGFGPEGFGGGFGPSDGSGAFAPGPPDAGAGFAPGPPGANPPTPGGS